MTQQNIPQSMSQKNTRIEIADRGVTALGETTKGYADSCWQEQPTISPDAWRLWEGLTVNKAAFFVTRQHTLQDLAGAYEVGMNWWCIAPGAEAIVADFFSKQEAIVRQQIVVTLLWAWQPEEAMPALDGSDAVLLVWPEEGGDVVSLADAFTELESAVQTGALVAYGFACEALGGMSLQSTDFSFSDVYIIAQQAAEKVWQRKKRPALRLLGVPLNVLELQAIYAPYMEHKGVAVSVLEWAVHMNIGVLALRPLMVRRESGMLVLNEKLIEQPEGQVLLTTLQQRVDAKDHDLNVVELALHLMASVPGVMAVLPDPIFFAQPARITKIIHRGGVPDVAQVLGSARVPVDNLKSPVED